MFQNIITGSLGRQRSNTERDFDVTVAATQTAASSDGLLTITIRDDLDLSTENAIISIEGISLGIVFNNNATDDRFDIEGLDSEADNGLQNEPITITATLTEAELDQVLADGVVEVNFTLTSSVNQLGTSIYDITIEYDSGPINTVADSFTSVAAAMVMGDVFADNGFGADSHDNGLAISISEVEGAVANLGAATLLASGSSVTLNADGTFDYTPDTSLAALRAGESFEEVVNYVISDGTETANSTLTFTVEGEDLFTLTSDSFDTDDVTPLSGNVFVENGNGVDTHVSGTNLTVTEINGVALDVGQPITLTSGISLTLNADGSFVYTQPASLEALPRNVTFTDEITYTVSDGTQSDTTTLTFVLTAANNDDVFSGQFVTQQADTIFAGVGNDRVISLGGDDFVSGGLGDDFINGGNGNDNLEGRSGEDTIIGAAGDDTLDGGPGDDVVTGGDGLDTIFGGLGNDRLLGNDGNDTIHGDDGNDSVSGGDGDDNIFGGLGDDRLLGHDGIDTIEGGDGIDNISGGTGDDIIFGDAGDDIISADAGNDTVSGGAGNDRIIGSFGDDILNGDDGDDLITGGNENDMIFGGLGIDRLFGNAGEDLIEGGDGDDVISGGDAEDDLFGGNGADRISGGENDDAIMGELGNDLLLGNRGDDDLYGGAGDDIVQGGRGDDELFGGDGADTLLGGREFDDLMGEAGDDQLQGGLGDDNLDGGLGNDRLFGGRDFDVLFGGEGDDYLDGGAGNDTLTGGLGDDTFFFRFGDGNDTITDFDGNEDVLRLSQFGPSYDTFSEVLASAFQSGSNVIFEFDFGQRLTVENTQLSDFTADDFIII